MVYGIVFTQGPRGWSLPGQVVGPSFWGDKGALGNGMASSWKMGFLVVTSYKTWWFPITNSCSISSIIPIQSVIYQWLYSNSIQWLYIYIISPWHKPCFSTLKRFSGPGDQPCSTGRISGAPSSTVSALCYAELWHQKVVLACLKMGWNYPETQPFS